MNSLLYLSFCLSTLYVSVFSLSCMRCEEVTCKPVTCKKGVGLVKDVCGCCDVCAKTEQQICGGPWNMAGTCDKGLSCVVRKVGKLVRLQDSADEFRLFPGKCEQNICTQKTCRIHQTCTVINKQAVCECPRQCKNIDKPVCGLTNGVEYENKCQLRKYECKLGKKIFFKDGPCKRCFMRRKPYKFGEKIRKGLCQSCSCYHGSWVCKNICSPSTRPLVAPEGARCDVSGRRILCGPGLVCKPSPNRSKGNTFGICTGKKVPIPEILASPPPLPCPVRKCATRCKYGYIVSDNGCKTCQCRKKKSVCSLPKQTGPCLGSFTRYYFNHKVGKCMEFIYGGCQHNANNFKTRKACERKCLM